MKKQNAEHKKTETDRTKKLHAHHMPAKSVSPLSVDDEPCISMETVDHAKTASYNRQVGASVYRQTQNQLINRGEFLKAFLMDVNDIQTKFPGKYDKAIQQATEYMNLILGGK